jgi:endonuclease/exonuclease/phosphatase (EEP) superfamily protein YafD
MKRALVVAALLLAVMPACSSARTPQAPSPGRPHLGVMTYNVNYGLASVEGGDDDTMAAIEQGDADLVLLQETNEAWEQSLRKRFAKRYPHMAFRHCCLAGGLAVLSKHPLVSKQLLESEAGWFPAWRLVVDSPLGPLQVLNVHLRPPVSDGGSVVSGYFSTPPIREKEIVQHYGTLDGDMPTLIVGDFNESDGRAIAYLEQRGMRSGLPEFAVPQDTWRWNTSVGTVHSQLDHIVYHPEQLRPLSVRVLPLGRSDHMPVVGVFERAPRKR